MTLAAGTSRPYPRSPPAAPVATRGTKERRSVTNLDWDQRYTAFARSRRQVDDKGGPAQVRLGSQFDRAAVQANDRLADGKPEPSTTGAPPSCGISAGKPLEQPATQVIIEPRPTVGDLDRPSARIDLGRNHHRTTATRMAYGVVDQVVKQAIEEVRVGVD